MPSVVVRSFRSIALLAAMASFAGPVVSQDKKQADKEDEVIRIDTELIDVPVTVTDRSGKPVPGLKRSNFVIYEDGRLQELTEFSTTTAPFEIALLLDTSGSTRSELQMIKRAAQHFLDSLRPGDRVSIAAFRTTITNEKNMAAAEIVCGLTSNRTALRSCLDRVETSNGTPYYDGLVQIAETVFREPASEEFRGRRALVALTDGVDSTSLAGYSEAKELLEAAGIAGYFIRLDTRPAFEEGLLGDCEVAIRFSQSQIRRYYAAFGSRSNIERTTEFCQLGDFERLAISKRLYEMADREMSEIAKRSGGRVFEAADLSEARNAFKLVADEIGTRYSLGYYSSKEERDGKYRAIRVEVKGLPAGTSVRAREGYIAKGN